MRHLVFAALAAPVLLAWPTHAQVLPADRPAEDQPAPGPERVIMDATFWTMPVPQRERCLELAPGQLIVTLHLEGDGPSQPATFWFGADRYRDPDPAAEISLDVVRESRSVRAPISGGRYCYAILNQGEVPPSASGGSAGPIDQAQLVAVKMVHIPS